MWELTRYRQVVSRNLQLLFRTRSAEEVQFLVQFTNDTLFSGRIVAEVFEDETASIILLWSSVPTEYRVSPEEAQGLIHTVAGIHVLNALDREWLEARGIRLTT